MNDEQDLCVVCGEPSAALICSECKALIGAKRLRPTPTTVSAPVHTLANVDAEE